jgi:hypothetical protein
MIIQLDTLLQLSNVKQIENIESALSEELVEKYIELVPVFFSHYLLLTDTLFTKGVSYFVHTIIQLYILL